MVGTKLLLKACSILKQMNPSVKLLISGWWKRELSKDGEKLKIVLILHAYLE